MVTAKGRNGARLVAYSFNVASVMEKKYENIEHKRIHTHEIVGNRYNNPINIRSKMSISGTDKLFKAKLDTNLPYVFSCLKNLA